MPPSKKTKNTLACVFTVANVLGTWERYQRPLLIYRYFTSFSNILVILSSNPIICFWVDIQDLAGTSDRNLTCTGFLELNTSLYFNWNTPLVSHLERVVYVINLWCGVRHQFMVWSRSPVYGVNKTLSVKTIYTTYTRYIWIQNYQFSSKSILFLKSLLLIFYFRCQSVLYL